MPWWLFFLLLAFIQDMAKKEERRAACLSSKAVWGWWWAWGRTWYSRLRSFLIHVLTIIKRCASWLFFLSFICSEHCFVDIGCLKLYIYSFFLHDIFIEYRVVDLILIMVIGDLFQGIIGFSKKGVLLWT